MINFKYHLLLARCVDRKAQAPGKLVSINSISRENSGRLAAEEKAEGPTLIPLNRSNIHSC